MANNNNINRTNNNSNPDRQQSNERSSNFRNDTQRVSDLERNKNEENRRS